MTTRPSRLSIVFALVALIAAQTCVRGDDSVTPTTAARATLTVKLQAPAGPPIPRFITGKFAEHLGSNIYNGMCAEVLRNPTFADFGFWDGSQTPDGLPHWLADEEKIRDVIHRETAHLRWPENECTKAVEARQDALAHGWVRVGPRDAVKTSPDTGPHGGRAQRVEVREAGEGIAQWTALPLHRVRKYQYQVLVRSPDLKSLTLALSTEGVDPPLVSAELTGLSGEWATIAGTIQLPASAPNSGIYRLSLLAPSAGQFVIARAMLWPADQIDGADPDVIRLLKESRLPLLRWPGGNFVSAYRWRDGVGPAARRPTRPNYAWGGVEPNLFGTDEFLAFCRAVGAEPMICINAGDGTPEEAAQWVEYCNGPASSPMGALRAANGHPQPYRVRLWEVGNELWGHWQVSWTTPRGYADRYRAFATAMLKADPKLTLYACGAPVLSGAEWNRALIAEDGPLFTRITDHPLIGGEVSPATDPLDVYRCFMGVPDVLQQKWAALRNDMRGAGIAEPRLAITELQLFAHIDRAHPADEPRLTWSTLVSPGTQAEALYDTLVYHAAARLDGFVDLVTHSAVVNHGGGLRKEFERVYANPCHYAQAAFAEFQGATPLQMDLAAPVLTAPVVLPDVKSAGRRMTYPAISALAARAPDGAVLISLVHRGTDGPIHLEIRFDSAPPSTEAKIWSLTAGVPWAVNTLASPEFIKPDIGAARLSGGVLKLTLTPYTIEQVRIERAQ